MRVIGAASVVMVFEIAAAFSSQAADSQGWQPSQIDVLALEEKVQMPPGALPLSSYARYYTGEVDDGHRLIKGYYLSGFRDRPGIYLKSPGTEVMDGGCLVISVYYDVPERKFTGVYCNSNA